MLMEEVKTTAIVLRISDLKKDAQGKRVSFEETLKNHKEATTEFCNKQGWKFKIYEEVLSGGSAIEERIELQKMLNDIETFDAIVVTEMSRLSRQGEISQKIKQAVINYRKLIITLNPFQVYDVANKPMDGMIFDINTSLSEYERRVIGMRIKQNKITMSKAGLNASGSAPLGYTRNSKTKKLEIDQEAAKAVRYAFKLCLEGLGARLIAEELNAAGYKTKNGNLFTHVSIKDMFKTQTYKGWIIYNDYIKTGTRKEIIDTITIKDAHEAIIDPEVFDKVQELKAIRAERQGQNKNRERETVAPSIIKDLLFCSDCGRKQRISYEKKRGHLIRKCEELKSDGTRCQNHGMQAANVEDMVLHNVLVFQKATEEKLKLIKSNDFGKFTGELEALKNDLENQQKTLITQFKAIRKMEMNYEIEKAESGFSDIEEEAAIAEDKRKNKEARMKVQQKLQEVTEKLNDQPQPEIEIKKLEGIIDLIEEIRKQPAEEKINMLLKRIIHKIHYTKILPPEIAALGAKNPKRKDYPADIKIDFINQ
ncbi:recombinase family protein [Bacillus sp. ISL-75]|uniref:recombinase family protein n=1 Tax=Bacillus sp. ISL-75 TaxID=2819137 RepID=UPI001BEA574F|nr:recombinase family protein [Bacillus sp. ISL-75]MBT2728360.1 recombinase family protein [Bacillus sp. ISL-75]